MTDNLGTLRNIELVKTSKRAYIRTYGCQMNVYDSGRMADSLAAAGYVASESQDGADLVLLNTCHIREKATEKIYSELGRFKHMRAENPDLKIVVAGCVAQAEGEEIIRRQPMVDIVVGPQSYHRLPTLLEDAEGGKKLVDTDFPAEDKFEKLPNPTSALRNPSAFLTVQEGCDKFCTFCVVPYTRGAEASRPATRILEEARRLVSRGVCEVTLLGQNVNAYHGEGLSGEDWSLARLIQELAELEGLERIRFTTSHPNDMSDDLINAFRDCSKLMPYLHLPVQSGSDRILKLMNRKHASAEYRRIVERLRSAKPDILLSGDFIVGFPGETEGDFQDTMSLVRDVEYGQAYSFRYSARPGTPAAERKQVDRGVASERLQRLQELLKHQQQKVQESMVGGTVSVLFERPGRMPGQLTGKSEYLHAVHADCSESLIGRIAPVKVTRSEPNSLAGVAIQ